MKKGILIVSLLCFSFSLMAQEEVAAEQQKDSIKGVHPYKLEENAKGIKPEIAHWSIIPHFGFSAFDGDFNTYTDEMKHRVAVPSVGLAVEYNFTPVWNVGVEYMYDMYTVTGKSGKDDNGNPLQNADTLLNGHMHKAGAYVSMDVINLFFPRAQKKIVSFLPYFGAGGAWYKRSAYYMDNYSRVTGDNPTHQRGNTANYINENGDNAPEHDKDYRMIGYIQAGANLEFNLNRTIALGIRANYTYFTRDYVDGRGYFNHSEYTAASKNNDGIFDITANLRFKLEAVSKSHPRNMPSFDAFDKLLDATEPTYMPHDTTIIIYRHDSIIIREYEKCKHQPRIFNVYFDNDKYNLKNEALTTIQEAASVMEDDASLYAVVIGYCDNTGSKAHNYELGDNRAKNVYEELKEEYQIPADHIYNAGVGKIAARRSTKSFGPNRRVSIHLVDKETFELMKIELQGQSEERNMNEAEPVTLENSHRVRVPKLEEEDQDLSNQEETIPLSETARKEKVNAYKERTHETIVVEKGMTLSKLARQYYNNTLCWVYIYMANTDVMPTPDAFKEGMELKIPELTKEEMQLEPKDCIRLYSITARENAKK